MMKKFLKALYAVWFVGFVLSCNISAAAENTDPTSAVRTTPNKTSERTVDVYLYDSYEDCVFMVNWTNDEQTASIVLRGPDDKTITANSQNTVFGKGSAIISAGSVESGRWYVSVTGTQLGTISVSGGNKNGAEQQYNAIKSFEATYSNGYVDFSWDIASSSTSLDVSITRSNSYYGTVWSDYRAKKKGSAHVSTEDFQTGYYTFAISVYDNGSRYSLALDEPIFVLQPDAPEKLKNVKVGSVDGEIFLSWDSVYEAYAYYISLYDYDTMELIDDMYFYESFCFLDNVTDKVKVSVAMVDEYNVYGDFDIFEIVPSEPVGNVIFPDITFTKESVLTVKANCDTNCTIGFYLDGTLVLEDEESGSFDINVSEGNHTIVAFIKDEHNNIKTFTKEISVDKTPPEIKLENEDHTVTSSDKIVISGSTEPGSTVAVNGVEQKLNLGTFSVKLPLEKGVNQISISSYDAAGNKSIKNIVVECNAKGTNYFVFVIPAVIFLLMTAWYIYLNHKGRKALKNEKVN